MKLFLDDYRDPTTCAGYMHKELGPRNLIYKEGEWVIVRNVKQFIKYIEKYGLPELISFDHDLEEAHYRGWTTNVGEYERYPDTGYDAAKWLMNYCMDNKQLLPDYIVHSMNPVGKENIQKLLENYKKYESRKGE